MRGPGQSVGSATVYYVRPVRGKGKAGDFQVLEVRRFGLERRTKASRSSRLKEPEFQTVPPQRATSNRGAQFHGGPGQEVSQVSRWHRRLSG